MAGIAVALSAAGLAVAIGTAAASGAAAQKSKKAAREAEKVAAKKLEEARREIQVMPLQELGLNLDLYKQQQEASQVAAAMSLEAARQADQPGLASVAAGRTQMVDISNQRQTSLDQAAALQKLEMIKATERQQASEKLANLSLEEAAGAQMAAAESDNMAAAQTNQAIQSGMQAVEGAANIAGAAMAPKMKADAAFDKSFSSANEADLKAYLLKNEAAMAALGVDRINALDMAGIKRAFGKYDIANINKWANPDYIPSITTPTTNILSTQNND
jgi:hypothetical protein